VSTVPQWSGREVRALRAARRMSLREFADHLGVSRRTIAKWEAGGRAISPGPENQEALDSSLALAGPDVRARFTSIVDPVRWLGDRHVFTHPVDGKLMVRVEAASSGTAWQPSYLIDVYATTNADYRAFRTDTGHAAPPHWPGGECPPGLLDRPVVNVSWPDAAAYARWADKSLPDEAQWRRADRQAYLVAGGLREWCSPPGRLVIGGTGRGTGPDGPRDTAAAGFAQDIGFRCVATAGDPFTV